MNVSLLVLTFVSVNLDFFFMLIFLLRKYRMWQVMVGYLIGNLVLLTVSYLVGRSLLLFLPEWLLGTLGILPIYLAFHDDDDELADRSSHGPVWSVLTTYLAVCTGCNLSIFLPVLVGESSFHFLLTLGLIGSLTVIVVALIRWVTKLPGVTTLMTRYGEKLMKGCYVVIGLYVFLDSGLIQHLVALL